MSVSTQRIDWAVVVERAATIVLSYDTPVTLRQLYYRLVAEQLFPNKDSSYKRLSAVTAEARRAGQFPTLLDRGREIHTQLGYGSPGQAIRSVASYYRRDRTEGQPYSLYVGVEKNGLVLQLEQWFGRPLGVPVLALGGYSSQSYADEVRRDVANRDRPAVLLYAGDHDASGHDIPRDFAERTDCWAEVVRVALTPEQVSEHRLPEAPGKSSDTRQGRFIEQFGRSVQVELDALPPTVLRGLYAEQIGRFWDESIAAEALERERGEKSALADLARSWGEE